MQVRNCHLFVMNLWQPYSLRSFEEPFEIAVSNTGLNLKPLPPKNFTLQASPCRRHLRIFELPFGISNIIAQRRRNKSRKYDFCKSKNHFPI